MQPPLTAVEARVLGSLLEKEVTTPDVYPLSLSALAAACNQTTNREPVMRLDEETLSDAVVALRRRNLLRAIQPSGSRVTKYQHLLADALNLDRRELAVLGVLLLRGPQTAGELHARTARLADFADAEQLDATLDALVGREPAPLVVRLARRAGQKEARIAHLLSGEVAVADATVAAPADRSSAGSRADGADGDDERLAALERTVEALREELTALHAQFDAFRAQFQ